MNPSQDNNSTASAPNPQHAHPHHLHHSPHKSPHATFAAHPADSPASGRQRVRTEPSPRHQHTSSGWLGPYHEQPSPFSGPSSRSPRVPRPPGSHASLKRGDDAGSASSIQGGVPDRILDTHAVLGGWHMDGGSSTAASSAVAGAYEEELERREFDQKQSDSGMTGQMIEPSNSLQSLVESIDDDHVFKLTEMTKKRVEHNNPAQKRQRIVTLPTVEGDLVTNFQPSEKTLLFSSSCKSFLESRYTQLYQSIQRGQPVNRLRKLHEILPHIKSTSVPKPMLDGKSTADSGLSRSRRLKGNKYRFVDKVEESSCIWDVDHMEAKAAVEAAAEATALAKQTAAPSSRHGSQQQLNEIGPAFLNNLGLRGLSSTSTESIDVEKASSEHHAQATSSDHHPYNDSTLAPVDTQDLSVGISPSSTLSSIATPNHVDESATTSFSSLDASPHRSQEGSSDSKSRLVETNLPASTQTKPAPTFNFMDGGSHGGQESTSLEASPSKRNSFLGIFGVRGKRVGQDSEQLSHILESPQPSSVGSPRLTPAASTQERRSFDSQTNPYIASSQTPTQTQRIEVAPPSLIHSASDINSSSTSDTHAKHRTSQEDAVSARDDAVIGSAHFADEDGEHVSPPSIWPQGERMDDSQDESDNPATATYKRSSLRRFKDKMTWKRGHKTLSAIQQGEASSSAPLSATQRNSTFPDGTKSLGKKIDPSLAYLHEKNTARTSASEPSSGRNSMESSSRPKLNFRVLSSSSSPVLEAIKNPDNAGVSSPRIGPMIGQGSLGRADKSPMLNPTRMDKSPMVGPLTRIDKSPMLNPSKADKSPLLVPTGMFVGEEYSDVTKQTVCVASQLLVDVDRIPKRLLQKLKLRSELASIDWTAETVDLSAMWTSPEPAPTYKEYLGISDAMKSSQLYPHHLADIDVLEIHLTLSTEEATDITAKQRARKWDLLELRVDQELEHGEKWIKEVTNWASSKANSIERHRQSSIGDTWLLDENGPLVEEPGEEEGGDVVDESVPDKEASAAEGSEDSTDRRRPHIAPLETLRARKQQRELSLSSARDLGGSMSSLQTSMTYTFKASLHSTRESIKEMRVYLEDCRQRLRQLNEATGEQLLKKEPVFKDVVDKFTMEWNESYFVKLKEVEDQIQVMNLKRIENPWMDMLLIMLSWFIRGLFYIVEGVTIMIIILRHAWGKAKKGYGALRSSRREQERLSYEPSPHGGTNVVEGSESSKSITPTKMQADGKDVATNGTSVTDTVAAVGVKQGPA
ncbi:hypothetical protein EDD11_007449 [Mortierella claussenii]|nr:hypothetical protein EDD11_007449 [Mortierella claussenii]